MSEKTSGSFSIDTYLSKQEGLLLEHIRRMLQAETKITLLEAALQDMYKRNEELSQQIETTNVALDQAINGLSAVTNERNALNDRVTGLEAALVTARSDLNKALVEQSDVEKLKSKLNIVEEDYRVLKQNYSNVLERYNTVTLDVVEAPPPVEKKKKIKSTESEWTDGKY